MDERRSKRINKQLTVRTDACTVRDVPKPVVTNLRPPKSAYKKETSTRMTGRRERLAEEQKKAIIQLASKNRRSAARIARLFNVGASTVKRLLRTTAVSEEQRKKVIQLFHRGYSKPDIVREVNVMDDAVAAVIQQVGLSFSARDKMSISHEQATNILQAFENGHSGQYIREMFGVSNSTVKLVLGQHGKAFRERNCQTFAQMRPAVLKLNAEGLSRTAITKQLKVNMPAVKRILDNSDRELFTPYPHPVDITHIPEPSGLQTGAVHGCRRSARLKAGQRSNSGRSKHFCCDCISTHEKGENVRANAHLSACNNVLAKEAVMPAVVDASTPPQPERCNGKDIATQPGVNTVFVSILDFGQKPANATVLRPNNLEAVQVCGPELNNSDVARVNNGDGSIVAARRKSIRSLKARRGSPGRKRKYLGFSSLDQTCTEFHDTKSATDVWLLAHGIEEGVVPPGCEKSHLETDSPALSEVHSVGTPQLGFFDDFFGGKYHLANLAKTVNLSTDRVRSLLTSGPRQLCHTPKASSVPSSKPAPVKRQRYPASKRRRPAKVAYEYNKSLAGQRNRHAAASARASVSSSETAALPESTETQEVHTTGSHNDAERELGDPTQQGSEKFLAAVHNISK